MNDQAFQDQIGRTLGETHLDALGTRRQGKVRDTYRKGDLLFIVTSDRISAFDHVLGTVPFKGEILNRTAAFWFEKTRDVALNHVVEMPDPNVLVARACQALPVELVVRGYLTGSLWRDYLSGRAGQGYGLMLPEGMRKDERFAKPIITPTTKAEEGHDQPISYQQIIEQGMVAMPVLDAVYERSLALFARGQQWALSRGLILVDTKYEFGLAGDELLVIDEIHTMDSSRYWEASEYPERFEKGEEQKMLDKENVRQWLIRERNYAGDGPPPSLTDQVRVDTARIYARAFERITGQVFEPRVEDVAARVERNLKEAGYLAR